MQRRLSVIYWFADEVTGRIEGRQDGGLEGSRRIIAGFINAGSEKEIVFTLNATHALSMAALGFRFQNNDVVLLTDKEHNSNLIPWLRLPQALPCNTCGRQGLTG